MVTAVNLIVGIFLILIGILVKHRQMYNLIAGHNTMPSKERINFDIQGFATLFRNCFVLTGSIIILGYFIFQWLGKTNLQYAIIGISLVIIIPFLLIKGQKFYKKKEE